MTTLPLNLKLKKRKMCHTSTYTSPLVSKEYTQNTLKMSESLIVARVNIARLEFVPCAQPLCPHAPLNLIRQIIYDDLLLLYADEEDNNTAPATYAFYLNSIMVHNDEDLEDGEVVMINEDAATFEKLRLLALDAIDNDICLHPFPPVLMMDDPTLFF